MSDFTMSLDEALREAREQLKKNEPDLFTTAEYMAANNLDNYNVAYKEIIKLVKLGRVEAANYRHWKLKPAVIVT